MKIKDMQRWELALDGIKTVCDANGVSLNEQQVSVVTGALQVWIDNLGGEETDIGILEVIDSAGKTIAALGLDQAHIQATKSGSYKVFVKRIEG